MTFLKTEKPKGREKMSLKKEVNFNKQWDDENWE